MNMSSNCDGDNVASLLCLTWTYKVYTASKVKASVIHLITVVGIVHHQFLQVPLLPPQDQTVYEEQDTGKDPGISNALTVTDDIKKMW